MFSLWERNCKHKQNNRKGKNAKQPSPNLSENPRGLAQDPNFKISGNISERVKKPKSTIKRTFPFISRPSAAAGSMTVEAALVLPLFLFFFLNLGSVMEVMRLHGKMEAALWNVGRETGVYGSVLRLRERWAESGENRSADTGKQLLPEVGEEILSYAYVRSGVEKFLGEEYLNGAPIRGGAGGLYFLGSDLVNEDDVLEIVVTYPVEAFWNMAAFRPFLMENRYYGRMWTGYDLEKAVLAVYYLSDNEEVFHTDRSCTHLFLSVHQISRGSLITAVNERGQRYRKCEKCVHGWLPDEIWVAKEGDCYHARRDCSGLKRTYRAVTWEEARKYRPCSRCGNKQRQKTDIGEREG